MYTNNRSSIVDPILYKLEQERLTVLSKNRRDINYGLLFMIGSSFVLNLLWARSFVFRTADFGIIQMIVVLAILTYIIIIYLRRKRLTAFKRTTKTKILNKLLQSVDSQLTYHPKRNISGNEFEASGIFHEISSRYNCEGVLEGQQGNITFRLAEVKAQESYGKHNYNTFFYGPFIVIELAKYFSGKTYVLPTSNPETFFNWTSCKTWDSDHEGEELKFNDSRFSRAFRAISNDPNGANILSEKFRSEIQKIGHEVYASFSGNNIYLAVNSRREFLAINPNVSLLKANVIKDLKKEIELLVGIVDSLATKNTPGITEPY
jgi:hypothetical protein